MPFMQETEFIAQNKEKWREFEEILKSKDKDPDRLTELFIETTDDLSFARTFYPNRSVRVYLNGISQKVHQIIYKNKRKSKSTKGRFWKVDLPFALFSARKELLLAFAIFMTAITIGVVSDMYYPEFANLILSDGYVAMTEAYIEEGDPMKVYKDEDPVQMFFMIGVNNIQISFAAFVLGLFWGVGTLYVLLSNGIMFGAFMHFFFKKGLAQESVLTVMQHGTLELSMIVISAAAGFMISRGILFPGTYSRLDSMVLSARRAIKVMIPVFFLLIYAALIESFLTRYTEIPDIVRAFSILLSAALVIGYFIWLPWHQYKRGAFSTLKEEEIASQKEINIELDRIKSIGQIFNETFSMFSKNLKLSSRLAFIIGLLVTLSIGISFDWKYSNLYDFDIFTDFNPLYLIWCWTPYYFFFTEENIGTLLPYYVIALAATLVLFQFIGHKFLKLTQPNLFISLMNSLITSAIVCSTLLMNGFLTFFSLIFLWPIVLILFISAQTKNTFILLEIGNWFSNLRHNFFKTLGVFWTVHSMQWISLLTLNGAILFIFAFLLTGRPINIIFVFLEFIQMNIPRYASIAAETPYFLYTLLLFYGLTFVLSLSVFSSILLYFSNKEVTSAETLQLRIQEIGKRKRIYGVEHES